MYNGARIRDTRGIEDMQDAALASYASPDRGEVMQCIQGMPKALPQLSVSIDVDSDRSDRNWEHGICGIIPLRDAFYLFWSASASKSRWLDKEWRCAPNRRQLHYIDPCPLMSPEEVPPPPDLESLHLYDRWLVYEDGRAAR